MPQSDRSLRSKNKIKLKITQKKPSTSTPNPPPPRPPSPSPASRSPPCLPNPHPHSDSEQELEQQPQPEPEQKQENQPEPEPEPEQKQENQPEPEPEPEPEPQPEPEPVDDLPPSTGAPQPCHGHDQERPSTEPVAEPQQASPDPASSHAENPNILPISLLLSLSNGSQPLHPHPPHSPPALATEIAIDNDARLEGSPSDLDPFKSVYPLNNTDLVNTLPQQHELPALLDIDHHLNPPHHPPPEPHPDPGPDPGPASPPASPPALSDAAFHALLFASLSDQLPARPQPSASHSPTFDALLAPSLPLPLPPSDGGLDQHQHAQDLLQALQALQTGLPSLNATDTTPGAFAFGPEPLLSAELEMLLSASDAPSQPGPKPLPADPALSLLFRPPSAQTDTETDLLLARLDERLAEDARLDELDRQVEEAVEANEAYGARVRSVLENVGMALKRAEEVVNLANFCVNELQNRASGPSTSSTFIPTATPVASTSRSLLPLPSTNQIAQNNSTAETPLTVFANGTRAVSLPWFKWRFGVELPSHEDGLKRDAYNALLHQQAWQASERRKLDEVVMTQKQKNKQKQKDSGNWCRLEESDESDAGQSIDWSNVSCNIPDRSAKECKMQWTERQDPLLNKAKWGTQEVDRLFEIVRRRAGRDWRAVAKELGTRRTPAECVKQYRMVTQERREWTEPDDVLLKEGMSMYGQNWQAVANHCGRSSNQCINRWSKTLRPDIKKGKWDPAEDVALKNAVAACGMVWKDVAPRVRGRTDAQCRERWCNILDPRIVVGNWSKYEDGEIIRMREQEGKTWSEISKSFGGRRTDNHCMRRYSELTRVDGKKKAKPSAGSSSASCSYQHQGAVERRPQNALGRALVASSNGFTRRNQGPSGSGQGGAEGSGGEKREAKRVRMEVG